MFLNKTGCDRLSHGNDSNLQTLHKSLDLWHSFVLLGGLAITSTILAKIFNFIRSKVYLEKDSVDADFDAGGKVSVGLTASTIVSQWTWAATLLQSSSVASKYGISGSFWYASGATIQILLFSMLSVQLKIKAPGAKTFLQVIKARFGSKTHLVFCFFALLTNVLVTSMLMLGGAAVMTSLVKDLNIELATSLVAAIIGSYTYIGGLGATFYVSYFNIAVIFVIMLIFLNKVYNDDAPDNPLGSTSELYNLISCVRAPDGNLQNSHLTMVSYPGLMFGIINIVGNFGTVFVDQSYWQSSVAAKPKQGVYGFLIGGLVWFAVPFTFSTTMGLAYTALSANEGLPLLSEDDVNAGLVAPVVAQKLLGGTGEFLILLMLLMAVTSTGSSEVIAVTSILVYDIYQIYLKPFRLVHDANSCILCGRSRGRMANPRDKCVCISMTYCEQCEKDTNNRKIHENRPLKPPFQCKTHGQFREYNNYMVSLKNWCILWITLSVVPLTIILQTMKVSLGWVYLFMGILIGSAVIPIALCMFWRRLSGHGMIVGSISGTIIGLTSWLTTSGLQHGGLKDFFGSTGSETSMLVGNISAIISGGVITILVSLIQTRHQVSSNNEIWENTRDINNPLHPWPEMYARELHIYGAEKLDNRPDIEELEKTFKNATYTAVIGSAVLTVILIVVWPAILPSAGVFSLASFKTWVGLSAVWGTIATIVIIVVPVVSEIWEIYHDLKKKKSVVPSEMNTNSCASFSNVNNMKLFENKVENGKTLQSVNNTQDETLIAEVSSQKNEQPEQTSEEKISTPVFP